MSGLFDRVGDRIACSLSVDDKMLLVQIPDLLADVGPREVDPAHEVLNRRAHRDNEAATVEFDNLVSSQLAKDRRADIESLMRLTQPEALVSVDDAKGVLRAINAARLTLAARSRAFDDPIGWEHRISGDPALAAVAWLGYVESELLTVLGTF
jgi:citrate lyase gamma subunit